MHLAAHDVLDGGVALQQAEFHGPIDVLVMADHVTSTPDEDVVVLAERQAVEGPAGNGLGHHTSRVHLLRRVGVVPAAVAELSVRAVPESPELIRALRVRRAQEDHRVRRPQAQGERHLLRTRGLAAKCARRGLGGEGDNRGLDVHARHVLVTESKFATLRVAPRPQLDSATLSRDRCAVDLARGARHHLAQRGHPLRLRGAPCLPKAQLPIRALAPSPQLAQLGDRQAVVVARRNLTDLPPRDGQHLGLPDVGEVGAEAELAALVAAPDVQLAAMRKRHRMHRAADQL
mmetsp:Transcript_38900/g.124810  ORF Transcript_38900/g.124810 Transcript_38900/m.124810 type:complete len:289 (+) Transcript_38900:1129-1995(+)